MITHSVRPLSVKRSPFYHHLQTSPNKHRLLLKSHFISLGTNVLLYLPPPVANEHSTRHRNNCAARPAVYVVIFTLVKHSLLCQVFRTIGENESERERRGTPRLLAQKVLLQEGEEAVSGQQLVSGNFTVDRNLVTAEICLLRFETGGCCRDGAGG